MLNLFICMTLCGFWHGAGFTFIIWGMYHGLLLVANHTWRGITKRTAIKIPRVISIIFCFMFVLLGWVLFRAESLFDAYCILKSLFNFNFVAEFGKQSIFARIPFLANWSAIHFTNYSARSFDIVKACIMLICIFVITFFAPNAVELTNKHIKLNYSWLFVTACLSVFCFLFFSKNAVFLYFNF